MKKNYSIILGIAACLLPALAVGQTSSPEMPNGNYLVVGAYLPGSENYLDLFMKGLQAKGLSPKSGFETKRNLLYVYLDVYQDFNESVNQMLKARQNPDLGNAWVRAIKDGTVAAIAVTKAISSETVVVKKQDPIIEKQPETKVPNVVVPAVVVETPVVATNQIEVPKDDPKPKETINGPINLTTINVFISLRDAQKDKEVEGDVEIIDTERSRLMTKLKGNVDIKLP